MNRIAFLILAAAISGCVSCSVKTHTLLTPQQVIDSIEPKEAETIGVLEIQLRKARQALVLLAQAGEIDQKTADIISGQTRVVDYAICSAWKSMVEGDVMARDLATKMAEEGMVILIDQLKKVLDTRGDQT